MNKPPDYLKIPQEYYSQHVHNAWLKFLLSCAFNNKEMAADPFFMKFAKAVLRLLLGEADEYEINSVSFFPEEEEKVEYRIEVNGAYMLYILDQQYIVIQEDWLALQKRKKRQHEMNESTKPILLYLEMTDCANYLQLFEPEVRVIKRNQLMPIFEEYMFNSPEKELEIKIYYDVLQEKQEHVGSFMHLPTKQWHWFSWNGFFEELQRAQGGYWRYRVCTRSRFDGFSLGPTFRWDLNSEQSYCEKNPSPRHTFFAELRSSGGIVIKQEKNFSWNFFQQRLRLYKELQREAKELGLPISKPNPHWAEGEIAAITGDFRKRNLQGQLNLNFTKEYLSDVLLLIENTKKALENQQLEGFN